jgi:hypothetical protein
MIALAEIIASSPLQQTSTATNTHWTVSAYAEKIIEKTLLTVDCVVDFDNRKGAVLFTGIFENSSILLRWYSPPLRQILFAVSYFSRTSLRVEKPSSSGRRGPFVLPIILRECRASLVRAPEISFSLGFQNIEVSNNYLRSTSKFTS